MTVPAISPYKAGPYQGNDVTTEFSFGFKVFADTDVRVVLTTVATGLEEDLVLGADYSIRLNADQNDAPGGTITYPLSGSPMSATHKLTAVSNLVIEQETDITNGGGFYPEVIEAALDRLTVLTGQQQEQIDRCVKVKVSSESNPDGLMEEISTAVAASQNFANNAATSKDQAAHSAANAANSESASATSASESDKHKTTAARWATKTDGTVVDAATNVDSLEYSAKAYAIGGSHKPAGGCAKDWATKTDAEVVPGQGYGAKKYAEDAAAIAASVALVPAGTRMLFQQTNAPTGWTKVTDHNNKALRIVSGAAGSGGSLAFTTAFASRGISGAVQNHTLSWDQMPWHDHEIAMHYGAASAPGKVSGRENSYIGAVRTGGAGASGGHAHGLSINSLDMAVQYVDVIIAEKD